MSQERFTSFPLQSARVHEVCGPSALSFAAIALSAAQGSALWVSKNWSREELYPVGLSSLLDPTNLLLARPGSQADGLAVAEEALRNEALSCVVIEITQPLDLREGRRLQLAARAGNTTGLCIIPEGMGSNAAETRWYASPVFDPEREDSTLMHWSIIKNKKGTNGAWNVRWDPQTRRLHVVSPVGE